MIERDELQAAIRVLKFMEASFHEANVEEFPKRDAALSAVGWITRVLEKWAQTEPTS